MCSHVSDFVISLAGRDRDEVLLVMREEENYLWLANGKTRRAEKPKRKKRRHTAFVAHSDARTRDKLLQTGRLTNSDIRKALSIWAGENQNTDQERESEHG
nr:KOW domain-containing RNA-binding protein [uncultured Butyricicoccus sp.]